MNGRVDQPATFDSFLGKCSVPQPEDVAILQRRGKSLVRLCREAIDLVGDVEQRRNLKRRLAVLS